MASSKLVIVLGIFIFNLLLSLKIDINDYRASVNLKATAPLTTMDDDHTSKNLQEAMVPFDEYRKSNLKCFRQKLKEIGKNLVTLKRIHLILCNGS